MMSFYLVQLKIWWYLLNISLLVLRFICNFFKFFYIHLKKNSIDELEFPKNTDNLLKFLKCRCIQPSKNPFAYNFPRSLSLLMFFMFAGIHQNSDNVYNNPKFGCFHYKNLFTKLFSIRWLIYIEDI